MRRYHEGELREWVKVHIAVDVENKELLSIEVTGEKTEDSKVFESLVEDLDLVDCLADGAYDSEEVFELPREKGVDPPGIKTRKNARPNLSSRGQAVRLMTNDLTHFAF